MEDGGHVWQMRQAARAGEGGGRFGRVTSEVEREGWRGAYVAQNPLNAEGSIAWCLMLKPKFKGGYCSSAQGSASARCKVGHRARARAGGALVALEGRRQCPSDCENVRASSRRVCACVLSVTAPARHLLWVAMVVGRWMMRVPGAPYNLRVVARPTRYLVGMTASVMTGHPFYFLSYRVRRQRRVVAGALAMATAGWRTRKRAS